jgi:hypothetical protein
MKPESTAATNAHAALREAAAALAHGRNADPTGVARSDPAYQLLAADLARNLDALAAVMRATGIEPVATHRTGREFSALLAQVTDVAAMARAAAGTAGTTGQDGQRPRPSAWSAHHTPDD